MRVSHKPRMTPRLLQIYLRMHALLLPLLAVSGAAAGSRGDPSTHLAASTGGGGGAGAELMGDHAYAYGAMTGAAASRKLLHGRLKPRQYPPCPRCHLISCSGGWWTGHCRSGGQLFTCNRSKSSVSRVSVPDGTDFIELPVETAFGDLGMVDGDVVAAPFVGCAADADCSLPAHQFTPVNGTAPVAEKGYVQARCLLPEASAKQRSAGTGACVCDYMVSGASVETDGVPVSKPEATLTRDEDALVADEAERDQQRRQGDQDRVVDFCVLRALPVLGQHDPEEKYVHEKHAEIGPLDTIVQKTMPGSEGDGPDLTGVTVSNAVVGFAVEEFDADYDAPDTADPVKGAQPELAVRLLPPSTGDTGTGTGTGEIRRRRLLGVVGRR